MRGLALVALDAAAAVPRWHRLRQGASDRCPFPFQPAGTYMTPRGHIYAPGRLFREDFSRAGLRAIERPVRVP